MTPEEIETEFWAYHFTANPATDSSDDEDFNSEKLAEAMESDEWIDEILGGGS
jgi:hypothetical protein